MNLKTQAETVAEAFAQKFLEDEIGHDIFIGSHIEKLLDDKAPLIYQYTEDQYYHGAAFTHQSGGEFIALNTFQPVRMRYFTAAHELWHLSEGSRMQSEPFDHERAADRFAAAVMLPKGITLDLWKKFKKAYGSEETVIHLADLASVPYEAVSRRLRELGIRDHELNTTEAKWKQKRLDFNMPGSLLDEPQPFENFDAYERIVSKAVDDRKLDALTAANKIARYDSKLAKYWQEQEVERVNKREQDDA